MDQNNKSVVLFATVGESTDIVYNALSEQYYVAGVIMENHQEKKVLLKRRIKKLGFVHVAGQLIFQVLVVPFLGKSSRNRYLEIIKNGPLNTNPIPASKIQQVININGEQTIDILQTLAPDVVVVNGTRIISKKTLNLIDCPIINMHAGITPKYRGVHGGYWALARQDYNNCGVTVHLVDAGIDTGKILYQALIKPTVADNFTTYPLLQLEAGLPLLKKAVQDALNGELSPKTVENESGLWYHPTFWAYLKNRLRFGVK